MFLAGIDLLRGVSRDSEVLDAVRNATPRGGFRGWESRRAFEREYGPMEMEVRTIAAPAEGGWVEVYALREDGTVERTFHEGGSEEAARVRREARLGSGGAVEDRSE